MNLMVPVKLSRIDILSNSSVAATPDYVAPEPHAYTLSPPRPSQQVLRVMTCNFDHFARLGLTTRATPADVKKARVRSWRA